jgi:hypothetical protein
VGTLGRRSSRLDPFTWRTSHVNVGSSHTAEHGLVCATYAVPPPPPPPKSPRKLMFGLASQSHSARPSLSTVSAALAAAGSLGAAPLRPPGRAEVGGEIEEELDDDQPDTLLSL